MNVILMLIILEINLYSKNSFVKILLLLSSQDPVTPELGLK